MLSMCVATAVTSTNTLLGAVQPVQVCRSHQQVADVMRLGVDVEANLDDALSEMDRLADML